MNRPGPYALRVVNGAPNGLGRVTGGTIALNDVTLVGPRQLGASVEFLTGPFDATLIEINRLDLDLTGPAGSFVTSSSSSHRRRDRVRRAPGWHEATPGRTVNAAQRLKVV